MAESDGTGTDTGQRLTTYEYDEHDRLTRQTSSGPSLDYTAALTSDDGTAYAEVWTPPSRVAVYCLMAFATLTLGALFVPLRLLRSRRPDVGREVRRRRTWIQTIALALIPLMAIGPEAALAIHNEALLYEVVAAAAAGQTGQHETTYTYDANGNMVTRTVTDGGSPATDTYIYDAQNRLVAAELTVDETAFVSYGYDADGIRNRVTKNGVTTWHLTDPNRDYAQVLAEHNGSGEVYVRYCYGDDLISQTRDPSGSSPVTRFYHYDGQLSTRHLTEGTPGHAELGALRDSYTFDAFGNQLTGTDSVLNSYRYAGEQLSPELHSYYLRARYYSPATARFHARDSFYGSATRPLSLNPYAYCANNPISHQDPSGHCYVGQLISTGIMLILFSANFANAPGPGDVTYGDTSGDMFITGAVYIGTVLGLRLLWYAAGRWISLFRSSFRSAPPPPPQPPATVPPALPPEILGDDVAAVAAREQATIDFLRRAGRTWEANPAEGVGQGPRAFDGFLDTEAYRTELKFLTPGASARTMRQAAKDSARGEGGQMAEVLVFDARWSGMSENEAMRGIGLIYGLEQPSGIGNVWAIEVIGSDYYISPFAPWMR